MARPSTIDRLPGEVRELISELRGDGRTIDEIMAKLRELREQGVIDKEPSRSAVGRHTKEVDETFECLREARAAAETLAQKLDGEGESRQARINIELGQTLMYKLLRAKAAGADLDSKEALVALTALQKLNSAAKAAADTRIANRKEMAAEVAAKVKEVEREVAAGAEGAPQNLGDALKRIREEVYGIVG